MKRLTLSLVMLFASLGIVLAQRTVTGKVSDVKGEAIIGANVLVKGTTTGAATDVDGNYRIAVPEGASTLVFSYVGFTEQEVNLGASNVVDIKLVENSKVLTDVVVTALGIAKQDKSIGYSVSKVTGSSIASSGEVNAVQGLAAKASGIQVIGSAGVPGASTKILLRGNSTFTGENQPLFVVDGVPFDNQTNSVVAGDYPFNANLQGVNESNRGLDLNPNDIENITILKGPSASALYGTRAANGVILVTTKTGRKGLSVEYGITFDQSQVNKLPELQTTYGQGNGGGAKNATTGLINEEGTYGLTPNSWGPKAAQTFDNYGNYFQKANSRAHNFSISGGTDKTTFRFSFRNDDQTGIVPNTSLKRNTFRLNAATGTDKVKVAGSLAYTNTANTKAQNGSNLSGVMLPLLRMPSDFNIIGGDGENGYENRDGSQHSYLPNYDNPLWTAYNNPQTSNVNRITGNVKFDYTPISWLTLTYRIGTDVYNDSRKQIFDIASQNIAPVNGEIWESNNKHEEINSDFFVTANKTFGDFSTKLTVGNQLNQRFDQAIFTRGRELTIPGFYNLGNASQLYADESNVTKRIAGAFFTADIDYKDFVYLNIAGRNDWSSTFGPEAKNSFFYPSASLSVLISELMPQNNTLTYLKVRGAFAKAGREPGAYSSRTYFVRPFITDGFTDGFGFPYIGVNGFGYSNTLGNAALRPEINTSYEAGFEAKFLKNRVSLNFTYYNALASDLLVARPIASTTGFRAFESNSGEMRNSGIEMDLDIDVLRGDGFKWSIGGVFTKNKSEVLKLADGVDQISLESAFTGIGSYAIVGQPYGAIFGTKWQRNDAGQLIIGANGIPLRQATEGYIGNPYPDWMAGIRNTFSYKGLRLYGLLDIRQGGDLWGGTIFRLNRIGKMAATEDRKDFYVIEGVKADGTPNDIKVTPVDYFTRYLGDGGGAQEQAIYSGGWIRLREVTLSYNLPKFVKVLKNASIFVTGRNLWLSTKYPGVDPETSLTGAGSNIGGFDYFNMPNSKSYIIGLNASF